MNAGFQSLAYLKSQLLAEALRGDTAYDAMLTALGLGVVAAFEKHCNRLFQRTASATYDCSADRDHLYLPRAPVESIASVTKQSTPTDGFTALASQPVNWEAKTGLVYFGGVLGLWYETLRVTYTGGWFWNTTEDAEDALPAGATALPEDLRLAWILQCKKVWEVSDPIGAKIVPQKDAANLVGLSLAGLELVPQVKALLAPHVRFQTT